MNFNTKSHLSSVSNLKQRIKLSFLLHKRIEISLLADCSILHDKDFIIAAKNRFLKAMRYDDSCHSNQIQYGKTDCSCSGGIKCGSCLVNQNDW